MTKQYKNLIHRITALLMFVVITAGLLNWQMLREKIVYGAYADEYTVTFSWVDEANHDDMEQDIEYNLDTARTVNIFGNFAIKSPSPIGARECVFTISDAVDDIKRDGYVRLDMEDENLKKEWEVTYDAANHQYVFTNIVDEPASFSTSFHWYVNSREAQDDFTATVQTGCKVYHKVFTTTEVTAYRDTSGNLFLQEDGKTPMSLAEIAADSELYANLAKDSEGEPIEEHVTVSTYNQEWIDLETNPMTMTYHSEPDELQLDLTGNVLDAPALEKLDEDYTWFRYDSKIKYATNGAGETVGYKARGLKYTKYTIEIQLPDDFITKCGSIDAAMQNLVLLDGENNIKNTSGIVPVQKDGHWYISFDDFSYKTGDFGTGGYSSNFKIGLKTDKLDETDRTGESNRLYVTGSLSGEYNDHTEMETGSDGVTPLLPIVKQASETVYLEEEPTGSTSGGGRPATDYGYSDDGYTPKDTATLSKGNTYENSNHTYPTGNASKQLLGNTIFTNPGSGRVITYTINGEVKHKFGNKVISANGTEMSKVNNKDANGLTVFSVDGPEEDLVGSLSAYEAASKTKYNLVLGDDALAVHLENGTVRQLTDSEYNFTSLSVPQLINRTDVDDLTSGFPGYNFDVYIKRASDGAYEQYGLTGSTKEKTDIYFTGDVKAVCVVVKDLDVGVDSFPISVGVNVHFDGKTDTENIEANNGLAIDTSNRITNYSYMQVLMPNNSDGGVAATANGTTYKDYAADKLTIDTAATGLRNDELTVDDEVYGINGYAKLGDSAKLYRAYSNTWLRKAMTTVSSSTKVDEFSYVAPGEEISGGFKTGISVHKTHITTTGTIQSESAGSLHNFRVYSLIPDNLELTDETLSNVGLTISAVQQASGMIVNDSYLEQSPYVYTLKLDTVNGKKAIVADFHFEAPLKMDEETKVVIDYDAYITADVLSNLSVSKRNFTATSYTVVLDSGVEVKNKEGEAALVDLVVDSDIKKAAASNGSRRINLADKQRSIRCSKYVETSYTGDSGSVVSRVEGKNVNSANAWYRYHLSFTDYINVNTAVPAVHNPIIIDVVEDAEDSKWKGELQSVDVSESMNMGFEPVVYVLKVPANGEVVNTIKNNYIKAFADVSLSPALLLEKYAALDNGFEAAGSDWTKITPDPSSGIAEIPDSLKRTGSNDTDVYIVAVKFIVPDTGENVTTSNKDSRKYMIVTEADHTITLRAILNMQAPDISNGQGDDEADQALVNNNQASFNEFTGVLLDTQISNAGGDFTDATLATAASNQTELLLSHLVRLVKIDADNEERKLTGARFSFFYDEDCTKSVWWWCSDANLLSLLDPNDFSSSTPKEGTAFNKLVKMRQISDKRGYVEVSLSPGTYYFKEDQSPAGYSADTTTYRLEVPQNNGRPFVTNVDGSAIDGDIYNTADEGINIKNERIENVKARFVKFDATSKTVRLNGAEYKIYKVEDDGGKTEVNFTYCNDTEDDLYKCYVYETSGGSPILVTGHNGVKGEILVANLPTGLYAMEEYDAPDGYRINTKTSYFRVAPSRVSKTGSNGEEDEGIGWLMFLDTEEDNINATEGKTTLERYLYDYELPSPLRIRKTAFVSGLNVDHFTGSPLGGATYTLLRMKDKYGVAIDILSDKEKATASVDAVAASDKVLANADLAIADLAANGLSSDYWETAATRIKTDSNGYATVTDLGFGYYAFYETAPPKGYKQNTNLYKISSDGKAGNITGYWITPQTAQAAQDSEPYCFYHADEKKTGSAKLTKIDPDNKDLGGAYYKLWKMTVQCDANGVPVGTDGNPVVLDNEGKITSGNDYVLVTGTEPEAVSGSLKTSYTKAGGELVIGETETVTGLEWGTGIIYYFMEDRAPQGYSKNTGKIYLEIKADNADMTIVRNDTDMPIPGSVDLHKYGYDDTAGNVHSMAGSQFNLVTKDEAKNKLYVRRTNADGTYNAAGAYWTVCESTDTGATQTIEITAADNGHIKVRSIPWGNYYFTETAAPSGYGRADDIPFAVNAFNCASEQQLKCEEPKASAEITIEKAIPAASKQYFDAFGDPTFVFKITKWDKANNKAADDGKSFMTSLSFNKLSTETGDKLVAVTNPPVSVDAGSWYRVEEVAVSRYGIESLSVVSAENATYETDDNVFYCDLTDTVNMPKIQLRYENEIKRYDMLSHTSSQLNEFTLPPSVSGIAVDYDGALNVNTTTKKNTIDWNNLTAMFTFNTTNEAEATRAFTLAEKKNLKFTSQVDGVTVKPRLGESDSTDSIVIDYTGTEDLSSMYGLALPVTVTYTDDDGTYTAPMTIAFNSKVPNIKKYLNLYCDVADFDFDNDLSKAGKQYTYTKDGETNAITADPAIGDNFGLVVKNSASTKFEYWALLDANGDYVTDSKGNYLKFKTEEAIRNYMFNGTKPASSDGSVDSADDVSEIKEFNFKAVKQDRPARLIGETWVEYKRNSIAAEDHDYYNDQGKGALLYYDNPLRKVLASIPGVTENTNHEVTNVTKIDRKAFAEVPENYKLDANRKKISADSSDGYYTKDAYAYFDSGVIYWYTEDDSRPLLAGNQSGLFYNFTALTDISGITDEETGWITYDRSNTSSTNIIKSITMMSWFLMYTQVATVDMHSWDVANCTHFDAMFNISVNFTLNLSTWDFSSASGFKDSPFKDNEILFRNLFYQGYGKKNNRDKVTSMNLSKCRLPNGTNKTDVDVFDKLTSLTDVDISYWNCGKDSDGNYIATKISDISGVGNITGIVRYNTAGWDFANIASGKGANLYSLTGVVADPNATSGNKKYNADAVRTWKNVEKIAKRIEYADGTVKIASGSNLGSGNRLNNNSSGDAVYTLTDDMYTKNGQEWQMTINNGMVTLLKQTKGEDTPSSGD